MELTVYWLAFAENKLEEINSYYAIKANKRATQKLINGIIDTTKLVSF